VGAGESVWLKINPPPDDGGKVAYLTVSALYNGAVHAGTTLIQPRPPSMFNLNEKFNELGSFGAS